MTQYPVIGARVFRITKEDICGVPAFGGNEVMIVQDNGWASVAPAPNYFDGTEYSLLDSDGRYGVRRAAQPELLDITLAIVFNRVDPSVYTAITGKVPIRSRQAADLGDIIGWRTDRSIRPHDIRWGLELWSDAYEDGCTADGLVPYAYFGWPTITGGKVSDVTIENNAVTFGITEARTKDGTGWGVGPYLVDSDDVGDPAPLETALGSKDHDIFLITTVAPPEATNGFLPLDDPDDADATTATAGSPGTFNGVRPEHLAGMAGVTASPTTTWTTGQSVILGDGTHAHWITGSPGHWAAGIAT